MEVSHLAVHASGLPLNVMPMQPLDVQPVLVGHGVALLGSQVSIGAVTTPSPHEGPGAEAPAGFEGAGLPLVPLIPAWLVPDVPAVPPDIVGFVEPEAPALEFAVLPGAPPFPLGPAWSPLPPEPALGFSPALDAASPPFSASPRP